MPKIEYLCPGLKFTLLATGRPLLCFGRLKEYSIELLIIVNNPLNTGHRSGGKPRAMPPDLSIPGKDSAFRGSYPGQPEIM